MTRKKVAVVTGGTRGIGRAISLALARENYKVFAIYARERKSAEALEQEAIQNQFDIRCLRADLTDDEKRQQCVSDIKLNTDYIDVLVHSAASGVHRPAMELTPKHLSWTFEINLFAVHKLILDLIPMMPHGGRMIGITSQGGTRVIPFYTAVGASKGALEALFRHYAQELAPKGIAVNLVCPGLVLTEAVDAFPDKEKRVMTATEKTPTGRLTSPEDVANTVLFLCSEMASQIVGQTIVIDGGKSLLS